MKSSDIIQRNKWHAFNVKITANLIFIFCILRNRPLLTLMMLCIMTHIMPMVPCILVILVFIKYQRDATFSVYLVFYNSTCFGQFASIIRSNLQTVVAATGGCYRFGVDKSRIGVTGSVCIIPGSNYSWRWTRTASETCRVVKNKPNKQNKLHLVGIFIKLLLLRCTVPWT